jgi:DNA invertase Pin-like site-specific DNA recombinase
MSPSLRASEPLPVDGYVRVSRVGRRRGERFMSPALQREQIEAWASACDARVLTIFEELDQSGRRPDRPLLEAAIERIENGVSRGIVVATTDRFGRSMLDALLAIKRVQDAGGHFFGAQEGFDLGNDVGRMMVRHLLSMAEWESDRKSVAWQQAKAKMVARGAYPSSHVPFGYRRRRAGRLRVDPHTGPLVTELFRRRADGVSVGDLCRWLEGLGVKSARGNSGWSLSSMQHLLRNRAYLGEIHWGRRTRERAHEPLTDAATWQRAQRPQLRGTSARHPSLLTGLVRCASCSMSMSATSRRLPSGRRLRVYYCHGRSSGGRCPLRASLSADPLETHVQTVAFDLLRRRRRLPSARLREAERKLEAAEQALAAYRDSARLLTLLGEQSFAAGLAARNRRLIDARLELADVRIRHAVHELPPAAEVERRWPTMTLAERRELLAKIIDCVFVSPGRFRVEDRVTVCPAGTAPARLPRIGDKRSNARAFRPRRSGKRAGTRPSHRWSNARLERELGEFLRGRTHWPTQAVFYACDRAVLLQQATLQAGEESWAHHFGLPMEQRPAWREPWTEERIRAGLDRYLADKRVWPTIPQFRADGLYPLRRAVERSGGLARWAPEYPHVACPQLFRWTDAEIRRRLQHFCRGRTTFPTSREFAQARQYGLQKAVYAHHGANWWAQRLGIPRARATTRPGRDRSERRARRTPDHRAYERARTG